MRALRLDRVALNVSDLDKLCEFYTSVLDFTAGPAMADPPLARVLGVRTCRRIAMRRGAQFIELTQTDPPGAPYPAASASSDLWFQHCALATTDMQAAVARLAGNDARPISTHGPQLLPGGIVAYKFRDPDGHPLELISFPRPDARTAGGIDHSAIAVADVERSIAFYVDRFGLRVASRQVNTGPAQDLLDGLVGVEVDVVALSPEHAAPHVELLGYRRPSGRAAGDTAWSDIAATRLVFAADASTADGSGGGELPLRDPDGHVVLIEADGVDRSP